MSEKDPYYFLPECSNSDLSWMKSFFEPTEVRGDKEQAYKMGTLLDCMITEPQKVDYFKFTCAGYRYTSDEFRNTELMKKSFWRHPMASMLAKHSNFQKITRCQTFTISYDGVTFALPFRIKWDLHAWDTILAGGDIKSTAATTQKQFTEACHYFEYFRQRAVYMDVESEWRRSQGIKNWRIDRDVLIGVSKVNHQVFTVPIERGDDNYLEGFHQYTRLGFQYATLFGNLNAA